MSLAWLSADRISFSLINESIFLGIIAGEVRAREVYDVFFTPLEDMDHSRVVCISPHDLGDTSASIKVDPAPGAGSGDDRAYESPIGFGRTFNPETRVLSVRVVDVTKPHDPQTVTVSGQVVVPEISIPSGLRSEAGRAVMEEVGTIFEWSVGPLYRKETYALRLVLEPRRLLGVSARRPVEPITGLWSADMHLACPQLCFFDVRRLLDVARKVTEFAATAAQAEAIICDHRLRVVNPDHARIVLVLPPKAELRRERTMGCIVALGASWLATGQLACEWFGGRERFWSDDPEFMARAILQYLLSWAIQQPKSKEQITTALAVSHGNCSLIVDSLVKHGAVEVADRDRGLFVAKCLPPDKSARVTELISRDEKVIRDFEWVGYRIDYEISYVFLRHQDMARMMQSRLLSYIAVFLAILSMVLSLVALFSR